METNDYSKKIRDIESLRTLCIIGIFIPLLSAFASSILYYKLNKKISLSIVMFVASLIPFVWWFIIAICIIEANKRIKDLKENYEESKITYSESDISQYEDEVIIDEDALNRYLSHKSR